MWRHFMKTSRRTNRSQKRYFTELYWKLHFVSLIILRKTNINDKTFAVDRARGRFLVKHWVVKQLILCNETISWNTYKYINRRSKNKFICEQKHGVVTTSNAKLKSYNPGNLLHAWIFLQTSCLPRKNFLEIQFQRRWNLDFSLKRIFAYFKSRKQWNCCKLFSIVSRSSIDRDEKWIFWEILESNNT